MRENRGPWYLLTGFMLGVILGLGYAWLVQPVQYTNTNPSSLRAEFKDRYRALIAVAYQANGDLVRAKGRLTLLEDLDVYRILTEQAQRTLASGGSPQEARALGLLAVALGAPPATVSPAAQTTTLPSPTLTITATLRDSPTPSNTITSTLTITTSVNITPSSPQNLTGTPPAPPTLLPTFTPLPSLTPTPTSAALFVLNNQEQMCNPDLVEPLIQVQTYDTAGQPVPGIEIIVSWETGENHFYTGLKPELGLGYADFTLTPGIIYTLRLAKGGQTIPGLSAPECEASGGDRYWGSWLLAFEQP